MRDGQRGDPVQKRMMASGPDQGGQGVPVPDLRQPAPSCFGIPNTVRIIAGWSAKVKVMTSRTPAQPRPDRRRARHEATKNEILDTAWSMVRADGLAALSLRALAHAVDMEPQSVYTYFASKSAIYDRMFADGNQELVRRFSATDIPGDARAALRSVARIFVEFAAEDQARYQLLFLRTIPGFRPSPESRAVAGEVLARMRAILSRVGLRHDADLDLWTAVVAGLASQQLANDYGADRYLHLIDEAVSMFADHALRPGRDERG
jgi:AcrR family transcriptional regulator